MGTNNNYCCVPQCFSKASKFPSLSFHRFPKNDRRQRWIIALRIGKEISDRMVVCSKHFKRSDYFCPDVPLRKKHLKKTAIPSLFLPVYPSERTDNFPAKMKSMTAEKECKTDLEDVQKQKGDVQKTPYIKAEVLKTWITGEDLQESEKKAEPDPVNNAIIIEVAAKKLCESADASLKKCDITGSGVSACNDTISCAQRRDFSSEFQHDNTRYTRNNIGYWILNCVSENAILDEPQEADIIYEALIEMHQENVSLFERRPSVVSSANGVACISCYTRDFTDKAHVRSVAVTIRQNVFFPYVMFYSRDLSSQALYLHTPDNEFYEACKNGKWKIIE